MYIWTEYDDGGGRQGLKVGERQGEDIIIEMRLLCLLFDLCIGFMHYEGTLMQ